MAIRIAEELDVSPWDAMLGEVRRSAGRCRWVDEQLEQAALSAETKLALLRAQEAPPEEQWDALPGVDDRVQKLLATSRVERRHLASVSKAAIDAGVAERMVRNIEMEGAMIAAAIVAGLDAIAQVLTTEQRAKAIAAAHAKLLALPDVNTIDGQAEVRE